MIKKEASQTHQRFRHYASSELIALGIDLALLWVFVHTMHMHYLLGAAIAYICAVTIHHNAVRKGIFKGTVRDASHTYAFFVGVGLIGFAITLGFVAFAVSLVHLNYLFARLTVAFGVIPITYILNVWLTFVMPKPLPDEKDEYCLVGEHNAN